MTNQSKLPPTLSLDLKKNRIRVHKHTLHLLGDPDYIQLLVNPEIGIIAIRRSVREDYLAHKVKYCRDKGVELYSYTLLTQLRTINQYLTPKRSYRLSGRIDNQTGTAIFSMKKLVRIKM